jgi:hypothetical protein
LFLEPLAAMTALQPFFATASICIIVKVLGVNQFSTEFVE